MANSKTILCHVTGRERHCAKWPWTEMLPPSYKSMQGVVVRPLQYHHTYRPWSETHAVVQTKELTILLTCHNVFMVFKVTALRRSGQWTIITQICEWLAAPAKPKNFSEGAALSLFPRPFLRSPGGLLRRPHLKVLTASDVLWEGRLQLFFFFCFRYKLLGVLVICVKGRMASTRQQSLLFFLCFTLAELSIPVVTSQSLFS